MHPHLTVPCPENSPTGCSIRPCDRSVATTESRHAVAILAINPRDTDTSRAAAYGKVTNSSPNTTVQTPEPFAAANNAPALIPLDPGIRLEIARNLRTQSLEALQAAIHDWREAAGTGNYRLICARFVLRCIKDFRWFDRLAYQRYRETLGNRRAAA